MLITSRSGFHIHHLARPRPHRRTASADLRAVEKFLTLCSRGPRNGEAANATGGKHATLGAGPLSSAGAVGQYSGLRYLVQAHRSPAREPPSGRTRSTQLFFRGLDPRTPSALAPPELERD